MSATSHDAETTTAPVCVIVGESPVRLWGLTGEERLRRALGRAGATDVRREVGDVPEGASVLLLRADHVFEEPLFPSLLSTPGIALRAPGGTLAALHVDADAAADAMEALADGHAPAGLREVGPKDVGGTYNTRLRKRAVPYVLQVTAQERPAIEKRMFAGSYKGVTDVMTKYVYPWPARHATKWAAALRLKPNHVTFLGLLSTIAAFWLFWNGEYGWGLFAGWMMCLLDTVDGKLARVTLTSSKIGDFFDHSIDLVHPPFWYWAWLHGLGAEFNAQPMADLVLGVIVVGYVVQRLLEGWFITAFGIEMHIWRPFDSRFRLFTARRDPNMVLLTGAFLLTLPEWGVILVAAWTAISLGVHLTQIAQATLKKMTGFPINSWLAR